MKLSIATLRCFLSIFVIVFLLPKGQDVKAAQCQKSSMHRWRCAPCGRGTRCIFCQWCLCYCYNKRKHNRSKRSTNTNGTLPDYGNKTVQYKKPFIELFNDLEILVENDKISNIEIVELYKVTSEALSEDCEICNDIPEIEELRNVTRSIHERLEIIMISENITTPTPVSRKKRSPSFVPLDSAEGSKIFKDVVLNNTREALNVTNKIPESVKGMIDLNSTILLTTTTTTTDYDV